MASSDFSDYVECGLCAYRYGIRERIPKMLTCGDSYCDICLQQLSDNNTIICPSCKVTTNLSGAGIEDLTTVRAIIRMLDMACDGCQGFGKTRSCSHCNSQFCSACLLTHTKQQLAASIKEVQKRHKHVVKQVQDTVPGFCTHTREQINSNNSLDQLQLLNEQAQEIIKIYDDIISVSIPTACMTLPNTTTTTTGQKPSCQVTQLIVFGTKGAGNNQFHSPLGISVHNGLLYVADRKNKRMCIHTSNGEFISTTTLPHEPISLITTLTYMIISTTSNTLMFFRNGTLARQIGSMGNGPLQFYWPGDVTRGLHGELYVADMRNHRIQVLDETGNFLRVIDDSGPSEQKLRHPCAIAVEPSTGDFYVGCFVRRTGEINGFINIYTSGDRFKHQITKNDIPGVNEFKPDNLTFRDDDLLCISDVANHSVHLFRAGRHVITFGGPGGNPGQFNYPGGSVFLDNQLIVCDQENNRVQIFSVL